LAEGREQDAFERLRVRRFVGVEAPPRLLGHGDTIASECRHFIQELVAYLNRPLSDQR
jgi:hypothetical protein